MGGMGGMGGMMGIAQHVRHELAADEQQQGKVRTHMRLGFDRPQQPVSIVNTRISKVVQRVARSAGRRWRSGHCVDGG